MSDVAYITNAAATLTFTGGSKTVTVTGTNPILEGVERGDRAVDPNGMELAIDVVAAGSLTLLRNAPTSGTVQFDVAPVSRLRTSLAANAEVTREVYAKLLAASEDNRSIPVISQATAPPGSPADGDRHLVIATATGAFAGKEGYIAQYDAANTRYIFTAPIAGMTVTVDGAATRLQYTGSAWVAAGADAFAALAGATFTGDVSLTSLNGGPLGGFRNLLINPMGRINQRLASSNADDTYGHDRWNVLTQTGAVAVSALSDVENGLPSMMRMTQSQATAQRMGISQIVESVNCKHLRGEPVTLSGRVRCSAAATLRYAILEWTSTADSVTSDVVNDWTSSTYTAGNFFLASNLTVTAVGSLALSANTLTDLTALTGTLGSSMNNLIVLIWTEGTVAQNVTMDYALQLEQGSVAAPREVRPITTELHLCQRYYCKSFTLSQAPAEGIGSNWYAGFAWTTVGVGVASILFPVQMRANPSVTFFKSNQAGGTDTHWQWYDGAAYQDSSVTALSGTLTVNGMSVNLTVTGATQGRAYIVQGNWVASVEL
jgi:hypothetical protein